EAPAANLLLAWRWRSSVSTEDGVWSRRSTREAAGEGVTGVAMPMIVTQETLQARATLVVPHDAIAGTSRSPHPLSRAERVRLDRPAACARGFSRAHALPQRPQ